MLNQGVIFVIICILLHRSILYAGNCMKEYKEQLSLVNIITSLVDARGSALTFSQTEIQKPQLIYSRATLSEFVIAHMEPHTISRVCFQKAEILAYSWYVIGNHGDVF